MTTRTMAEGVRALHREIRAAAADGDRRGAVPDAVVERLRELGVFRMVVPRRLGGLGLGPAELVRVSEELGYADGSTGWVAMIGAATGIALAYLDPEVAREMLADPRFLIAGVAAPIGTADPVDCGYRVTGRWPFASGCRHATWLVGGCRVTGDRPGVRMIIMSAADVRIHDGTWDTAGLRGTGSHDIEADGVFVPAARSFSLAGPPPLGFPAFAMLALGIGAVALGIARAAIDEFTGVATAKRIAASGHTVSSRGWARAALARAEGLRASGLAYLLSAVDAADAADAVSVARTRLAVATATANAAKAVDLMYEGARGASIYTRSPLQRHLRDVHATTQHAMVGPEVRDAIGAVLLGEDPGSTFL
jgi:alkylation response protein AidB-like acyl-CoA dehydrogenase